MISNFTHQHIIVFISDQEHNERAIAKALRLAKHSHSRITLFCAGYHAELISDHSFDSDSIERAKQSFLHQLHTQIEAICQPLLTANDFQAHAKITTVWHKHSVEAVYEYNQLDPADLIIKSTHTHSFLQRTFLRNIDWSLIQKSFIPTLFVKSRDWGEHLNVVSCVDPVHEHHHDLDEAIIHLSNNILAQSSSSYHADQHHILHAFDPTPLMMYMDQPAIDAQMISSQIKQSHKLKLAELATKLNLKEEHIHLEQGSALQVIPDFVNKNNYHIVVLGGVCRHGIERFLIGNTAEKIMDGIDADLLIAPVIAKM